MESITKRQKDFLDYIIKFKKENGYSPTLRELGLGTGVSHCAALSNVKALVKKGFIHYSSNISRSIVILKLE
jgi:SOS-response transcriptional repressor LexA